MLVRQTYAYGNFFSDAKIALQDLFFTGKIHVSVFPDFSCFVTVISEKIVTAPSFPI